MLKLVTKDSSNFVTLKHRKYVFMLIYITKQINIIKKMHHIKVHFYLPIYFKCLYIPLTQGKIIKIKLPLVKYCSDPLLDYNRAVYTFKILPILEREASWFDVWGNCKTITGKHCMHALLMIFVTFFV